MSEKKKASDGDVGCFLLCLMAIGWISISGGVGSYYESEALGCIIFGAGTFSFGFVFFLCYMIAPRKKKKKDEQETSSGDS